MQNLILKIVCVLCVAMVFFGIVAGCGNTDTQTPTNPTDDPFFGDPTDSPTQNPTQSPADGDVWDGDDHVQVPFG